jgi:site-specific DNA-cytosine methylase
MAVLRDGLVPRAPALYHQDHTERLAQARRTNPHQEAIMSNKAVTLFSGLGSSSKALRDLGYDVVAHDFMPEAVETLRSNGFLARQADVREINYSNPLYSDVKVLAGGPPCQPFSQSHDGEGRYDERDMIPEFLRAIAEMLPELFVMEEVQTLTWKRHADYLAMVEDHMRTLGYRVEHKVLNAADYGHAQARKRLFVVGVREDLAQRWEQWITSGEIIAWPSKDEYIPTTMAQRLGWTQATCYVRNQQVPDKRARVESSLDPAYAWPLHRAATTVVGSFRPEVQAAPGYRKAGDGPRQSTKGSVVTTLEERLLLQDMPTDWVVRGSQAKRDLQVGNSVPCGLIRDLIALNQF